MLKASDFDEPLFGTPAPSPADPRSCLFQVGRGSDDDEMVLVRFAGAYERPDRATELLVGDGHSAAVTCATMQNGMQCAEIVAVNATESLEVVVLVPGANSGQVAKAVQGCAGTAFTRMVATS